MTLTVIGAGFGRTGTLSLKLALEALGFAPCYHMVEVFEHPEHIPLWTAATAGQYDWDALFTNYRAAVDWPACSFWQPLLEHYPEAKVILTVRDPQAWYASVRKTIYPATQSTSSEVPPEVQAQRQMANTLVWQQTFQGRIEEPDYAIAVFERHNAAVQAALSPQQLLVLNVMEGWEPLCRFLDCPVPDQPFPNTNSSEEFLARHA